MAKPKPKPNHKDQAIWEPLGFGTKLGRRTAKPKPKPDHKDQAI